MVSQASARSVRFEARLAPDVLAAVKRAAELQGRTVSDFVVTAAHEAARREIAEAQIVSLSLADQERIAALLADPPPPGEALQRAFAARRELIRDAG